MSSSRVDAAAYYFVSHTTVYDYFGGGIIVDCDRAVSGERRMPRQRMIKDRYNDSIKFTSPFDRKRTALLSKQSFEAFFAERKPLALWLVTIVSREKAVGIVGGQSNRILLSIHI